jgi:hypothetical protein
MINALFIFEFGFCKILIEKTSHSFIKKFDFNCLKKDCFFADSKTIIFPLALLILSNTNGL